MTPCSLLYNNSQTTKKEEIMHQYHNIYNLTQAKGYSSSSVGASRSIKGQAYSASSAATLLLLLKNDWKGQQVAVVGDKAEKIDLKKKGNVDLCLPASKYNDVLADKSDRRISNMGGYARKVIENTMGWDIARKDNPYFESFVTNEQIRPEGYAKSVDKGHIVAINHDKKQFVDARSFGSYGDIENVTRDAGVAGMGTALYYLLAGSNGRVEGELTPHKVIGTWNGDHVSVIDLKEEKYDLNEYTDISVDVRNAMKSDTKDWLKFRTVNKKGVKAIIKYAK